jgi:hypothetical protein
MTKQRIFQLGLGAFFAVAASHCGGSGGQQAETPQSKPASQTAEAKVSRDNPCSILLPNEVGEILGVKSEMREIMDEVTCRFHFEPGTSGATKSEDGETFVEVKVHWTDGRTAILATRTAGQLLGGDASGFEKVEGIGDEAWMAPMASYLAFSKGDVGVEMDMRMFPGEKEKTIRLAKLIASRV